MPDRQTLVWQAKDCLKSEHVTRQPDRMDLCTRDRRTACRWFAVRLFDWDGKLVPSHLAERLGQFPSRSARRVGFAGTGVVNHFPRRQVFGGHEREVL